MAGYDSADSITYSWIFILFFKITKFLQHAPSVKIVLRLRPRKGEGRVRSRSTNETLVIGQFFRRARDFPPNAEKKTFYALNNLFKSLLRN